LPGVRTLTQAEREKLTIEASKTSKNTIVGVCLSSFTCWLILWLAGGNWLMQTVKPLQFVKAKHFVPLEQNPLVSKFPGFFESKENQQLLILGSSMPMEAIARYDARFCNSLNEKSLNEIRMYTDAHYLEHLIRKKTGQPVKAFNLTCVACMASDAELILRRAIEADRVPQTVIFGIGPRDFIDNIAPAVGKSPVCQILSNRATLPEIFSGNKTFEDSTDLVLSQFVYPYKVRGDYKTVLTGLACDVFSRPADLYSAKQMTKVKDFETATNIAATTGLGTPKSKDKMQENKVQFSDLQEWADRYQPANFKRYEAEKSSFQKMLVLCKQKKINLIVVNMPITDENRKLIPKDIYKRYQNEICKLPAQYGNQFIDLDNSKAFSLSDFYDSSHVNAAGGKKVQDMIISCARSLTF